MLAAITTCTIRIIAAVNSPAAGAGAHLATGPTLANKHIKTAILISFSNFEADQLVLEAKLQGDCSRTCYYTKIMTAFLDKRKPHFEGRYVIFLIQRFSIST